MAAGLLIFDTHPIQYRSPVFRALFQRHPDLRVAFFNETFDGTRWWFHEVGTIPKQTWGLNLLEGFPCEILGTARYSPLTVHRALTEVLERNRPKAVAFYGYYLPEHWWLRLVCARKRIPLIFIGESFSSKAPGPRGWIKRPLQKAFLSGVSQFVAIGRRTETHYRDLGVAADRIVPAKYCVDGSFFRRDQSDAAELGARFRRELGIPRDALVALFVGRFFDRKRPHDMIALHRRVAASHPRLHTVLVGNGLLEDEVRKAIQGEPGIHLAGFRDQSGTREAYHGSDVLVVPSQYETWGLVVNEAAACGVPSLVTDTCGVAGDLVVDGETGFVFPVGNVEKAAEHLGRLLSDETLRRALGAEAHRRVERDYTPERFAEAFLTALKKATGAASGSSLVRP